MRPPSWTAIEGSSAESQNQPLYVQTMGHLGRGILLLRRSEPEAVRHLGQGVLLLRRMRRFNFYEPHSALLIEWARKVESVTREISFHQPDAALTAEWTQKVQGVIEQIEAAVNGYEAEI